MTARQKGITTKTPSKYAEALGDNFIASKKGADAASLGQYFTPKIIADLIAKNFSESKTTTLKILDPGAGSGILSCMLCENIADWKHKPDHIELIVYEIDKSLIPILKKSFGYLKSWLNHKNIWQHNLRSLSLDVSTGPVVAFRACDVLTQNPDKQNAPLLWLHNVRTMHVSWPVESRKPQYVKVSEQAKKLLIPNGNYVLVRRFSAKEEKKRLVAAPLISTVLKSKFIGIENHINYIYRKTGELSELETLGLSAILNSSLLDSYFRIFNGNTQVSATELRNLPLPAPRVIEKVGSFIKSNDFDHQETDEKVVNLITQYA